MNYELAKELKDAGFPQQLWTGQSYYYEGGDNALLSDGFQENENVSDKIKIPTLSELIEACGEGAFMLLNKGDGTYWVAALNGKGAEGITPEEAVARLWLALNKK